MAKDFLHFIYENGVIILESNDIDLKVDTNRKIYVRNHGEEVFDYIEEDMPIGFKKHDKEYYLMKLRAMTLEKLKPSEESTETKSAEPEPTEIDDKVVEKLK